MEVVVVVLWLVGLSASGDGGGDSRVIGRGGLCSCVR